MAFGEHSLSESQTFVYHLGLGDRSGYGMMHMLRRGMYLLTHRTTCQQSFMVGTENVPGGLQMFLVGTVNVRSTQKVKKSQFSINT